MKEQYELLLKWVREMRYYQKKYFETRKTEYLTKSKKAEKIVDELIAEDKLF